MIVEAERVQRQALHVVGQALLVENPQHRVLAEDARHHRHAEVDLAALRQHLEAAVLGHAPLGDVELGHHLDARDHLLGHLQARERVPTMLSTPSSRYLMTSCVAVRLQVDVAGAGLERVVQGRVHQPHDRALRPR